MTPGFIVGVGDFRFPRTLLRRVSKMTYTHQINKWFSYTVDTYESIPGLGSNRPQNVCSIGFLNS